MPANRYFHQGHALEQELCPLTHLIKVVAPIANLFLFTQNKVLLQLFVYKCGLLGTFFLFKTLYVTLDLCVNHWTFCNLMSNWGLFWFFYLANSESLETF